MVSTKTTLVTTDRSLSTRLVQKYRTSGFPVHSAMSAADLGIDRGFAARRRIPKHTRRWKSAFFPARKICRLARNLTSARTTRMLAVTGMLPSATYSSKLLGMAPSQLDRLRTATVNALMPRKRGWCRTTESEPGISIGVELIRSWPTWWSEHPEQHRAARRAWNILHQRISHIPHIRVGGHLAAVITNLLDAGWNPHTATCLEDPDGNQWSTTESGGMVDFSPILSAVAASLSSSLWRHAAELWKGVGAEQGLDLRSLRLHLHSLWKRGRHERFGIIHVVSSAATWTRVRLHMVRPASCPDAICRRCITDEIETDFHRVWTCPANRSIDGIEKSQHLLAEVSHHCEISGAPFGRPPNSVMLKFVGWFAMKKEKLIMSMPPWHGAVVLTRSQMVSPRLLLRCVTSLKLCQPSLLGWRARVGRSATVQRSQPWTPLRRTRLHHCPSSKKGEAHS